MKMIPAWHWIHRFSPWQLVIRRDLQGGEFLMKECLICGKSKTRELR